MFKIGLNGLSKNNSNSSHFSQVKCLSVRILSRAGNYGEYIFQTLSTKKFLRSQNLK